MFSLSCVKTRDMKLNGYFFRFKITVFSGSLFSIINA